MLNVLIPYIDQRLTEFTTNYGLAELVTEQKEEEARTFPAAYTGPDNYTVIDIEKHSSYHRIDGSLEIQETDQNTTGCVKGLTLTYRMLFIGSLPRKYGCDQYALDTIANGVAAKITQTKFPKEIRGLVKAWSIEINLRSILTSRDEIWNREHRNINMQANFDQAYFSVGYEIAIKADSSCLSLLDCTEPVVMPPNCSQISVIPNERLKCLTQEQIEYIAEHLFKISPVNIVLPSIQADNFNYESVLTVVPGEWIGTGVSLTYQWYRNGAEIPGETGTTYELGLSDTTQTEITVVETATNFYGSTSVSSTPITPTLVPETVEHYQRVIADSGSLATIENLNTLLSNSNFLTDLVCVYDPGVFGYKASLDRVSKSYSIDADSDIIQATGSLQPMLFNPTTGRLARVRTDNIEADISTVSPVFNSQGPQVLISRIAPINGARGPYLASAVITSVSMEYQTGGNQISCAIGGSSFSVPLGAFTPAAEFYIRGYYLNYPTYKIDVSNDGETWINVHSASRTQASFTTTRYGLGRATLSPTGPSNIFDVSLNRSIIQYGIDLDNFNPAVNSRQWVTDDGLTFNLATITTADDVYPSQIVTELTASFDGVTDKMQSGAISFPAGQLTIYAIIDWGMIQTGTRYCIDDTGGNISVWTDGTNIFVGDSIKFLDAGLKPSGMSMITFVKADSASLVQINQGSIITGDAGGTMPANLIVGGKTAVNTNNATLTRHKVYAFDGAHDLATRTEIQDLLNSIQNTSLF